MRSLPRKITVSGRSFLWKLRGNTLYGREDRHIVICLPRRAGHLLVDPYPWDLAIRPATVAAAIEFALSRGWDPTHRGPPVALGYRKGSFFVLPPGARFTSDLFSALQHASTPTTNASCPPSLVALGQAVANFSPWLDAIDIGAIRANFAAVLFAPGECWQALHAGLLTRVELRNVLLAHTQKYVGNAFQAPVSVEEMDAVLSPAFELVLFGQLLDHAQGAGEQPASTDHPSRDATT